MLRKLLTDLINGRALGSGKWALASALEGREKQTAEQRVLEEYQREYEERERESKERAERSEIKARNERNKFVEAATAILTRNADLVDKFLAIAEPKVSILDEYGDENWDALPGEIKVCLKKIVKREGLSVDWKRFDPQIAGRFRQAINNDDLGSFGMILIDLSLNPLRDKRQFFELEKNSDVEIYLLYNMLEIQFKKYHSAKLNDPTATTDAAGLSGVEFETYIARILTKLGYAVSGTRATGDQGADLIAQRDGRKLIIQAKRYNGPVGNKAVQEVIGALSFYGGDEGWVVTNSIFTPSAKALAQKANIKLIDRAGLAGLVAMEGLSQETGQA